MAWTSCRWCTPRCALLFLFLFTFLLPADGDANVRPLLGTGDFPVAVDVVNRWHDEERLDVLVLVEVVNGDLGYTEERGGLVGRLRVEIELESFDGRVVSERRPFHTAVLDPETAGSRTEFQLFGVLIENVPFRDGRIRCNVYDVRTRKKGLLNEKRGRGRTSSCAGAWSAPGAPRPAAGLALEDPLFLAHAPLMDWRPGSGAERDGKLLHDYIHPARRYGLEQDRLQLYLPMWPQAGGVPLEETAVGLRVQVTSLDMEFAVMDTVSIDHAGQGALVAGRPASLIYELDVNLLPEGSYLLNIAPLTGEGRGVVKQFDVVWRLAALARSRAELLGEGRTVFLGRDLDDFLDSSPVEQEQMLVRFWDGLNPDPENPVNTVYLEFQYRLAFVRQFLGGFGEHGALDARGEVFLALGMPEEVRSERMPMNFRDQDDARIKVFERFAPDREGTMARGSSGSQDTSPYSGVDAIPQPWSRRAEAIRQTSQQSSTHLQAFELWLYEVGGQSLWRNRFSATGMGQRFLFVDRTGTGEYFLESSNVLQGEE